MSTDLPPFPRRPLTYADIDAAVDKMVRHEAEAAGQTTLGQMIDALSAAPHGFPVRWADGGHPGGPHSYRGYYNHLAFSTIGVLVTVDDLLARCMDAVGRTFTGYKGGDFTMTRDTPLWRGEWGQYGGSGACRIVGMSPEPDALLLLLGAPE